MIVEARSHTTTDPDPNPCPIPCPAPQDSRLRPYRCTPQINGHAAEYAGSTREEREAWAHDQRRYMDESYRFSTFGKLGYNESVSSPRLRPNAPYVPNLLVSSP